jgi:hypothetical protein
MRRVTPLLAAAALATLMATSSATSAPARDTAPSRVIDRTVSCSVFNGAPGRVADITVTAGVRLYSDRSKWMHLASASTLGGGVSAGSPLFDRDPGFPNDPARLHFRDECRQTRAIPLSKGGLSGGAASQLGEEYRCHPGRRVLVRIRAVFRDPTTLRLRRLAGQKTPGRTYLADGTVVSAQVAVRSNAGKSLAYAEVFETGKARLFTAPNCLPR